ncbi:hypothetical protein [Bacillus mojavensis]
MTKVKFEERGILAGLVEINKDYQDFLTDIHEIVEDDLEIHVNKKDVIIDHWILKYPEKDYYGVYYKKGHQCTIDSSGEGIIFENWFVTSADELKYRIKEYVSANKSDKLLLRTVVDHFRSELELLRDQDEMYEKYEEVANFLVKTVSEARGE